jgi:hypothetical protein
MTDTASISVPGTFPHEPLTDGTLVAAITANKGKITRVGGTITKPVDLRSVEFDHAIELHDVVFEAPVDLRDARLKRRVELNGCEFRCGLLMDGARVDGTLELSRCSFGLCGDGEPGCAARLPLVRVGGDLLGRGIHVEGGIDLTRAEVRGRLDLSSLEDGRITLVRGDLRLSRAEVQGAVRLNGVSVVKAVDADGARIGGSFSLGPLHEDHVREEGPVLRVTRVGTKRQPPSAGPAGHISFVNTEVKGEINLTGIRARNDLNLQRAKVHGGVFCRCIGGNRPVVGGMVGARGAEIFGTADFSGALVGRGIFVEGCEVTGPLFLRRCDRDGNPAPPQPGTWRTYSGGDVRLALAQVTGTVEAAGLRVRGTLDLEGVGVTGFVSLSPVEVDGDLLLSSAQIHLLSICYAEDSAPAVGRDLVAPGLRAEFDLDCSGLSVGGRVDFTGARIGGNAMFLRGEASRRDDGPPSSFGGELSLQDCVVTGRLEASNLRTAGVLKLARADIRGDAEFSGARIHQPLPGKLGPLPQPPRQGAMDATGVRIRGRLVCNGAQVGGTLNLQSSRIGGGLFCGTVPSDEILEETEGMHVDDAVLLDGAEVLKQADFRGATIGGELSLERAVVEGRLRCPLSVPTGGKRPRTRLTRVDLRNLRVRHLDVSPDDRGLGGEVTDTAVLLEGCTFHDLSVPHNDFTAVFRCENLSFSQPAYAAVERWLRERGQDAQAEQVYRLMLVRRRDGLSSRDRMGDRGVELLRRLTQKFQALALLAIVSYFLTTFLLSLPGGLIRGKGEPDAVAQAATAAVAPAVATLGDSAAPDIKPPVVHPGRSGAPSREGGTAQPGGTPATHPRKGPTPVDAALAAAKVHLPMLGFPGDDDWKPSPATVTIAGRSLWIRYDVYGVVVSLLSYAIVPLIIGGIASTWLRRGGRNG